MVRHVVAGSRRLDDWGYIARRRIGKKPADRRRVARATGRQPETLRRQHRSRHATRLTNDERSVRVSIAARQLRTVAARARRPGARLSGSPPTSGDQSPHRHPSDGCVAGGYCAGDVHGGGRSGAVATRGDSVVHADEADGGTDLPRPRPLIVLHGGDVDRYVGSGRAANDPAITRFDRRAQPLNTLDLRSPGRPLGGESEPPPRFVRGGVPGGGNCQGHDRSPLSTDIA